jgi:hypothetical protein
MEPAMVEQVFFLYISLLFEPHFYGLGGGFCSWQAKKASASGNPWKVVRAITFSFRK